MATTSATAVVAGDNARVLIQTVVPVLDTNAYASLDALHTNDLLFPGMGRVLGGSGVITRMTIIDAADQGAAGVLHLFTGELTNTTHTANAAFAPTDADALLYVGSISFGPYSDFNTSQVSVNAAVRLAYKCAAASTSLYGVLQSLGTPTYAADSLTVILQAELD